MPDTHPTRTPQTESSPRHQAKPSRSLRHGALRGHSSGVSTGTGSSGVSGWNIEAARRSSMRAICRASSVMSLAVLRATNNSVLSRCRRHSSPPSASVRSAAAHCIRRQRPVMVESECDAGGFRSTLSVAAPFVWRCLIRSPVAPVSTPRSSNRTCRFAASGSRTRRHAFTHDGPRPSRVRRTSWKCP
jgi:hypothetical protein